jgi:hypothetical protein
MTPVVQRVVCRGYFYTIQEISWIV